jgi:hypothetical protein
VRVINIGFRIIRKLHWTSQSSVLVKGELVNISIQDVGGLLAEAQIAKLFVTLECDP